MEYGGRIASLIFSTTSLVLGCSRRASVRSGTSSGFGQYDWGAYMGAYLINYGRIRDGVPNQEGLAELKRIVEAYSGRWHSQGIEDARRNSLVLVEFGTTTEAQNWYNSSEYKNVSHLYVD